MTKEVWILAEQKEGKLKKITFELLGIGKKLAEKIGGSLSVLLLGYQIEKLAGELDGYGARKIFVLDSEALKNYTNESYAKAIVELVKAHNPTVLLGGATASGKDLFPRVSARLQTGLASDCIKLDVTEDGLLLTERPMYAGKVLVDTIIPEAKPQIALLRPNVLPVAEKGSQKSEIEKIAVDIKPQDLEAKRILRYWKS